MFFFFRKNYFSFLVVLLFFEKTTFLQPYFSEYGNLLSTIFFVVGVCFSRRVVRMLVVGDFFLRQECRRPARRRRVRQQVAETSLARQSTRHVPGNVQARRMVDTCFSANRSRNCVTTIWFLQQYFLGGFLLIYYWDIRKCFWLATFLML